MKEDKLGDLSMELSAEVLKLTKELRSKHETVISNRQKCDKYLRKYCREYGRY